MHQIEYKLLPNITEEILRWRFQCFNETLNYYRDFEASKESFDSDSFHLQLTIDGEFAAYTRLTPCPLNYMSVCKLPEIVLRSDEFTIEMGRTIVVPKYRGIKLVNTILLLGLRIVESAGYRYAIGNESYEHHLAMPSANGWEFTNLVADFYMPFSQKGSHTFYIVECDIKKTTVLRTERLNYYKDFLKSNNYQLTI